jgi:hypothetical protein
MFCLQVFAAVSQAIDSQDVAMKQWQQQQQGGGGNGSNEAAVAAAIVCRLQFRKQLLQGLIKLKRKQKQVRNASMCVLVRIWNPLLLTCSKLTL